MSEMDLEEKNKISFENFLKVIASEKRNQEEENESENLNTFVALGGNIDKSGYVEVKNIVNVLS